jgi:hypothetical protein
MRLQILACAAAILSACSGSGPVYEPASPQGEPPTKENVAANISQIFSASSHATDIFVTPARPAVERDLFGWLVCVRARVAGASGEDAGFQTTAVFYQKRVMVLRRRAEPQDKCEGFEKLTWQRLPSRPEWSILTSASGDAT